MKNLFKEGYFFIGMLCGIVGYILVGFLFPVNQPAVIPPTPQPTVVPTKESVVSRFEVTGIFIGECEPIELFNPVCSFRMDVETSTSDKVEPGRNYIFISRDKDMEEVRDGERVWVSCVRHNTGKYRCDFRGFQ